MIPIEVALLKREFHRLDQEGKLIEVNWKLSKENRQGLKAYAKKYKLTESEAFFIAFKIGYYLLEGKL